MKNPITQIKRALANRGHERDPLWGKVCREAKERDRECAWCGNKNMKELQGHHCKCFKNHPHLELADGTGRYCQEKNPDGTFINNVIILCERIGVGCHLGKGHYGNFQWENQQIREACAWHKNERSRTDAK